MSTKYIALVAAAAVLAAASTTEAAGLRNHHNVPLRLSPQEEAEWNAHANIHGTIGQPPQYDLGVSVKWDEEQGLINKKPTRVPKKVRPQQQQPRTKVTTLEEYQHMGPPPISYGFFDESPADAADYKTEAPKYHWENGVGYTRSDKCRRESQNPSISWKIPDERFAWDKDNTPKYITANGTFYKRSSECTAIDQKKDPWDFHQYLDDGEQLRDEEAYFYNPAWKQWADWKERIPIDGAPTSGLFGEDGVAQPTTRPIRKVTHQPRGQTKFTKRPQRQ